MRTAADRDLVARGRVADPRATTPCFAPNRLGSACVLEPVAVVGDSLDSAALVDGFDVVLALAVFAQCGLYTARRVVQKVNALLVIDQINAPRRACGCERIPIERRPVGGIRNGEHMPPRSDTRRIEVELLEARNLPGSVHALDTEQIARAVCRAAVDRTRHRRAVQMDFVVVCRGSIAAEDRTRHLRAVQEVDLVLVCRVTIAANDSPRHRRAVQMDFVAVCRPSTGRATVNSARSTYAVQVDLVVVYRRTAGGTSAIDIAAVIQCDTFVDRHYVVRCLAARHGRHTAIDIAVDRGSAVDCDLVIRAVALVRCCSL